MKAMSSPANVKPAGRWRHSFEEDQSGHGFMLSKAKQRFY